MPNDSERSKSSCVEHVSTWSPYTIVTEKFCHLLGCNCRPDAGALFTFPLHWWWLEVCFGDTPPIDNCDADGVYYRLSGLLVENAFTVIRLCCGAPELRFGTGLARRVHRIVFRSKWWYVVLVGAEIGTLIWSRMHRLFESRLYYLTGWLVSKVFQAPCPACVLRNNVARLSIENGCDSVVSMTSGTFPVCRHRAVVFLKHTE